MTNSRAASRNLMTVISLAILVGVEIFGVALVGGWAVAGLFDLSDVTAYALMAIFSGFGAYLLVAFVRNALKVEPSADIR